VRHWIAIGPAPSLSVLGPLRDEHLHAGSAELVEVAPKNFAQYVQNVRMPDTTVLMVEDPTVPSVRDLVRSPFVPTSHAQSVCVGWVRLGVSGLRAYALRAVALRARSREEARAIALLAPREDRYLQLLSELEVCASEAEHVSVFRWSAERIRREPLVRALRLGASAVVFSGHGTARGWFAYGGVSANTLGVGDAWESHQTCAVLFSLSCSTGAPVELPGVPGGVRELAFADGVVEKGIAGAVFAPLGNPLHAGSRVLARALVRAMLGATAGDRVEADGGADDSLRAVLQRALLLGGSLEGCVVLGDPEMPLRATAGAVERGRAVFAPAADAVLVARAPV
jgi:hypothetical protein